MNEYGISTRDLKRVSLIGAGFGVVVLALFLMTGLRHGTLSAAHVVSAIGSATAVGLVLPVTVFAGSIIKIRIGNGVIQQILLGRKLLAQKPLAELAAVSRGRATVVVLHFRDGSRMRLFGAPLWERERLFRDLQRLAPHLGPGESSGSGLTSA